MTFIQPPLSGRGETLKETLSNFEGETKLFFIEVGTSRNVKPAACISDGWATRYLAWWLSSGGRGRLTTIDNREVAVKAGMRIVQPWGDCVDFLWGDALVLVPRMGKADLLYLDGPPLPDFAKVLFDKLVPERWPRYILVDDVFDSETFYLKGEKLIPHLVSLGWRLEFCKLKQALLSNPER